MNNQWILNQLRLVWCKIKNIESGGTGGGIQSVQPGTNVTVDDTDPLNPIVNSTGGDEIDTLESVMNRGNYAPKRIEFRDIDNDPSYLGYDKTKYNIYFGSYKEGTVTGGGNTGFGWGTFNVLTSGNYNSAFGDGALYATTSGLYNNAFGASSLQNNTVGNRNVAVGTALFWNNTGNNNTGIGFNAGYAATSGSFNTYLGSGAGYSNGVGSHNLVLGVSSLSNYGGHVASTRSFNNNVIIGNNVRVPDNTNDVLAIDNKGVTVTNAVNALLYGGFSVANRFLNIGGKLSVTPSYMPNATIAETKKVVWNPTTGVFAVKDDITPSTISANKQRFTGDTTSAKTLTQTPKANSVAVILNGLELDEQGGDYTVSGTTVTLASEPLITDVIVIKYLY